MRTTPIVWVLLGGALSLAQAEEPSLIELLLGTAETPLAEVRKPSPIEPSDGARAYAEGLGLELEGVDTVRGCT
jgi:hypothetical protein